MSFDEADLEVTSGKGGDGMVHFRREKYIPRGGPDGGNGGKGGDVVLEAIAGLTSLSAFHRQSRFEAQAGRPGGPSDRTGKNAPDLVLQVPPGTVVRDRETADLLADLVKAGQTVIIARGGRGGRGNARYATSRNQAPRMAQRGEPGERHTLHLELRLIADVGIVGLPNAGKSTLLAALTRAHPKIADYPFTTLEPNLGVHEFDDGATIVLADIPGLIEGAHRGAGLGSGFLRHIQRTRALIHLVDGTSPDPLADFSQINTELALFDPDLAGRPQVVAINKADLPGFADAWPGVRASFQKRGIPVHRVSALTRTGLEAVVRMIQTSLAQPRHEGPASRELPVFRLTPQGPDFEVQREPDGAWRVVGKAIERSAAMTYWEYEEAVRRFQRLLKRIGVDKALRGAGARTGDRVRIGEFELEWQD
ncbi:MAG: GTPase ObgE [Anaerolineales bacterium]